MIMVILVSVSKTLFYSIALFLKKVRRDGKSSFYKDAEERSHVMTKWPALIFFGAFYAVILLSVIKIVANDLLPGGELHPSEWYLFYKMT